MWGSLSSLVQGSEGHQPLGKMISELQRQCRYHLLLPSPGFMTAPFQSLLGTRNCKLTWHLS